MLIANEQSGLYPHLVMFLKTIPLRVPTQKKRVWESFLGYSSLSDKQGRLALQWGTPPTIGARDLPPNTVGLFQESAPNTIYLNKRMVEKFETDWQNPKARVYMEATVLHELVHWGNHKAPGPHRHGNYGSVEFEWGDAFDLLAYGSDEGLWSWKW